MVGLIVSNTVGTPRFVRPAIRTEFYIKTGLVLLGAEVLFNRLLALGVPGIFASWLVTPVVLIGTYTFGQRVLKMESRSLNMVICADMSVCGVSAAIATAAACRAKKEELSLAIGLSLAFTVVMMVVMPPVIQWLGLGAGGRRRVDRRHDRFDRRGGRGRRHAGRNGAGGGHHRQDDPEHPDRLRRLRRGGLLGHGGRALGRRPSAASLMEIWRRFPKFVLGFLAASLRVFGPLGGRPRAASHGRRGHRRHVRDAPRLAVLPGLREHRPGNEFPRAGPIPGRRQTAGAVRCGQALNLVLSLVMCWLMFEKVFPNVARALAR